MKEGSGVRVRVISITIKVRITVWLPGMRDVKEGSGVGFGEGLGVGEVGIGEGWGVGEVGIGEGPGVGSEEGLSTQLYIHSIYIHI